MKNKGTVTLTTMLNLDVERRQLEDFLILPREKPKSLTLEEWEEEKRKAPVIPPFIFIERFLERYLIYFKFYSKLNTFYIYDRTTGLWNAVDVATCSTLFQNLLRNSPIGFRQPTAKYAAGIVAELKGTGIHEMGMPELELRHLCFDNGILNTETGLFGAFTHKLFLTVRTPYAYDPKATCPKFLRFIRDFCSGYEDRVNLLRA
jgi:hypothetical protein